MASGRVLGETRTASVLVLLALLPSRHAAAQSAPEAPVAQAFGAGGNEERERLILLVRTANDEGVMNRVRAELGASAWRILELRLDERLARVPLAKLSGEQHARAAVRYSANEARVELWVSRPTGDVAETLDVSNERGDDAVVALQISEALRARGFNLGPDTKASTAQHAAEAAQPARADEKPGRAPAGNGQPVQARAESAGPTPRALEISNEQLWLELAGAMSGSPGGLGLALSGWGSARLDFGSRWSCSLLGVIPLISQRLAGSEGSARVATTLLGAAAETRWLSTTNWRLGGGLGVFGALTEMRGSPASGYVGDADSVFALGPLGRATARVRLVDSVWLSAGGLAGLSFPEVSVKFADRVAGRWGRPLLMATLGVELRLLRFSTAEGAPARGGAK